MIKFKLKHFGAIAALGTIFFATASHAAVVIYDFTATVDSMSEWTQGVGYSNVSSGEVQGKRISNGNTLKGNFFFDTTASEYFTFLPADSKMYSGLAGMQYTFDESGLSFQSAQNSAYVVIQNNAAGSGKSDAFKFGSWILPENSFIPSQTGHLDLANSNATVFDNWQIPVSLSMPNFDVQRMSGSWKSASHEVNFFAHLNFIAPAVSAVPEPESVLMILTGLGLMGFALRRRLVETRIK